MFEIVSKGFKNAKEALTGRTELSEENIAQAVREIRVSLLEADVEVGVVKRFIDRVKERAIGEVVQTSLKKDGKKIKASPGEHFTRICYEELENLMGKEEPGPIRYRKPITVIMMVGLQGVGKTTTCGKLAHYLLQKKRKPMLVAADIYRPAAVKQLQILGEKLGVSVFAKDGLSPPDLCKLAIIEAKKKKCDVVILDTAGRLAIDDALMTELEDIKAGTKPDNLFLVCDAMAGQDTVNTAAIFNSRLSIDGFIMTKLDGDARGGAALSIREVTGKPIKFLGLGEDMGKLEAFRPQGLASRILGMGDVVGLMQDFESLVDEREARRDTKKMLKGQFTLDDFLKQLRMIKKLGSVKDIYEKMPIMGEAGAADLDDNVFVSMESIIQSMTPSERQTPQIINESRAKRIARGAGRKPEDVKDLVDKFSMMHQMMAGLATGSGFFENLPGIKQISQLRKLQGKGGMGDMFGSPQEMQKLMGGMGMPQGMGGGGPGMALPPGVTPEQYARAMQMMQGGGRMGPPPAKVITPMERSKLKDKRKAQKDARKKAKRR